jgi:hypothetical protein
MANMKMTAFRDMVSCSLILDRRFRGATSSTKWIRRSLHTRRCEDLNSHLVNLCDVATLRCVLTFEALHLSSWWQRQYAPLKLKSILRSYTAPFPRSLSYSYCLCPWKPVTYNLTHCHWAPNFIHARKCEATRNSITTACTRQTYPPAGETPKR